MVQTEEPTLWFYDVQQRLGPGAGRRPQHVDAALRRVHHSLQQRQALLGAGVGPGHGLTGGADQREVAHAGDHILGHNTRNRKLVVCKEWGSLPPTDVRSWGHAAPHLLISIGRFCRRRWGFSSSTAVCHRDCWIGSLMGKQSQSDEIKLPLYSPLLKQLKEKHHVLEI